MPSGGKISKFPYKLISGLSIRFLGAAAAVAKSPITGAKQVGVFSIPDSLAGKTITRLRIPFPPFRLSLTAPHAPLPILFDSCSSLSPSGPWIQSAIKSCQQLS